MDCITQLQDEIQQIRLSAFRGLRDETYLCSMPQILTIMSNTVAYLTSRANFVQVSAEVPITKQRNPEKYDAPDVFEANKKELVTDLIVKAKQVEYLIKSLPEPEPEEEQALRLKALQGEMNAANAEYIQAVDRASKISRSFFLLRLKPNHARYRRFAPAGGGRVADDAE